MIAEEEAKLVQSARLGDSQAWYALHEAYAEDMYRIVYGVLRTTIEDVEVVTQETWLKAFLKLGTFRGESSFKTWITRIGINEALRFRKIAGREQNQSLDEPLTDSDETQADRLRETSVTSDPQRQTESREIRNAIAEAVNRLSEKQRVAFLLYHVEDMKLAEIAQMLEITFQGVKGLLYRAENNLRRFLSEYRITVQPAVSGGTENGIEEVEIR